MSNVIPIGTFPDHNFDLELRKDSELNADDYLTRYAELGGVELPADMSEPERLEFLLSTLVMRLRGNESLINCFSLATVSPYDAAAPAVKTEWQPTAEIEELSNALVGPFGEAVEAYKLQLEDAGWQGTTPIDHMARFVVGAMLIGEHEDDQL